MAESSVNSKIRLLGGGAPSDKASFPLPAPTDAEPTAPAVPATPPPSASVQAAPPLPASIQTEPILLCDSADGADLLNTTEIVEPLAQLCATREVQTPFLAAIAGPAGAGKTFALRRLAKAIEQLSASPGASSGAVLSRVVLAYVDAASGLEAPVAIASAAYSALDREPGGADYSALLDEIGHAGGDPQRAARAASDRHDDVVRKLEAERSQRDDLEARRARLADALLFETPGSRIDVFVRANRGTIEACLRRFGLGGSDAGMSFRSLVSDMASLGVGARSAAVIRSIWGYRSQARLLFWAIVAFALAIGATLLHGERAIAEIGLNGSLKPATDWIQAHGDWFDRASDVLFVVGALAIALNLWRALTFSNLLMRGARLLNHEARERRRDLEARATRLNQRVAALATEVEAAAKRADSASRRAGDKTSVRAPGPEFLEAGHGPSAAARAFLVALASRIGQASAAGPTPDRLIFVIDNLDALPPAAAIGWIDAAQSVIGRGAVGLLAFDPTRLAGAALGGPHKARRRLGKWLQVTVNLPARDGADGEQVVARLLSTAAQSPPQQPDSKIAAQLVEPLSSEEATLLSTLAPLAAHSPRDAKHFLNAYRLARCSNLPRPVMALMQAVAFADDDSRAAMRGRLAKESGDLTDVNGPAALVSAVNATRAANNGAISIAEAHAAAEIARRYAPSL